MTFMKNLKVLGYRYNLNALAYNHLIEQALLILASVLC